MMLAQLKKIIAALVLLGCPALGVLAFTQGQTQPGRPGQAQAAAAAPVPRPASGFLEARIETARKILQLDMDRLRFSVNAPAGATEIFDKIRTWSHRLMEDRLRLAATAEERLDAIREHRNRMVSQERLLSAYTETGQGRVAEALEGKYYRLEADQLLAEAGVDPRKEPPVAESQQDVAPPSHPPSSPTRALPR